MKFYNPPIQTLILLAACMSTVACKEKEVIAGQIFEIQREATQLRESKSKIDRQMSELMSSLANVKSEMNLNPGTVSVEERKAAIEREIEQLKGKKELLTKEVDEALKEFETYRTKNP